MRAATSISAGVVIAASMASSALGAESHGALYPSISFTTDYRYNGVSFSDNEPAWQASLYWWHPSRYYAGIWSSQVDFNDPGHTSIEIDVYAGRTFTFNDTQLSLEILYTSFPDKSF